MPEIKIARQKEMDWSDEEKDRVRELLFSMIDGYKEPDKKNWRRLFNLLMSASLGEIFTLEIFFNRHGKFHRLHFAMEQRVFQNQERFSTMDSYRTWCKIGMGHCTWVAGVNGGIVPIPKSVDYKSMDQDAFELFHKSWLAFVASDYAAKVLWPKVPAQLRAGMVETLLEDFSQDHQQ